MSALSQSLEYYLESVQQSQANAMLCLQYLNPASSIVVEE